MKKITLIIALIFTCSWVNAQTYLQEDFNVEIPATWTVTDGGGATGDSWISGQQGGGNSLDGTNSAIVDSDSNGNGTELIETLTSPVFDTTGATALFLDFDQYYNDLAGGVDSDTGVVEVFDGTNWIEVLNLDADAGGFNSSDQQHIDITAYSNADMQIRFIYNDGNSWAWYWLVDNIQVYNSTCNFPSDLTVTNITSNSADLGWVAGGSEMAWEVINQEAGGPVPTDADSGISTGGENPFQVMGLTEGTNYEFYVRSDCDADGTSIWVGPFAYRISGPGEVCENPIIVSSSLPYTTTDDTVNYINDYNGVPGTDCGSGFGYLNGDDVVYAYTPTADTSIDISLSGISDNYTGVFVYTDCANIGNQCETGAVNGFGQGDLIIDNLSVTNGQTYYIVISTWAAPQNVAYTLTITENTCVDPVIDYIVRQDCINGPQFFIDVDLTDLGSATSMTISDDQGSASQNTTVAGVFSFGPFANNTPIIITVVNDDDANCNSTSDALTQDQCVLNVVDCTQPPLQFNYCYDNNDDTAWLFESNDGNPVRLTFNAGGIESCCDDILVYDGQDNTAPLIYQGNNGGDLSGLQFDSTGDSLYLEIDSDGSVSCASGSGCCTTEWDFTVACATCVNPEATYTVASNCTVGPEFFVDVDLTNLGSALSVTISDDQGSAPQSVSALGVVTFGPYANNTPVEITVANDDDPNCTLTSNTLTQEFCLDNVVDCSEGPINVSYCYFNNDSNVFTYTSTDGTALNLTFNSGEVEGAPYDFLVVYDTDGSELYNDEGNNGDLSGLTFQSTGDTISFQITSDGSVSCESGSFADGIDYTVSCATCINPAATYQVVDDCENGDQFLVDVIVTTIGDATSITISNNIDANTVSATAAGVYQVGPFPFATDVIITLSNDQDVNCIVNSSAIRLEACPPDNDNPCNATIAGVNADDSCSIITPGVLLEATDSGIPSGTCGGDPDDDVWFEFTALNEFQIIQLTNIDSSGFFENLDHAVYEGTCDAPVELYCSDADASLTPSLTVGNTYYVRVFSAGSDPVDYTFDLCIRPGSGNVSVDQTTYTIEELVVDVLINSPCAQITNIEFSTGTDFGDVNGIGYFSSDEGSFPFEEGLLLTTGDAALAGGPNFNAMSDGGIGWLGDADLDNAVGIQSSNATVIEFDFVPLSDEISFDFLMASEEYNGGTGGTFECTYSDAFAFLLTDENSVTTNLAVIPGSTTPILVTNIHPDNPGCVAINEEYFGGYTPPNLPPISFDGRTSVFTAFSPVNIGETYHIKLVIGDDSNGGFDTALDSGVFLKAGSFDIGEVELGADITVEAGTAACIGEQVILQTQAPSVAHVWYKDNFQIDGETSNVLVVTEDGTYTAQIIFSPSCIISDEIVVEFLPLPIANTPPDLVGCSIGNDTAVFNLPDNDLPILGDTQSPDDFTVTYHFTEQNAIDGIDPLTSPYTSVSDPQTIYALVTNNVSGCENTTSFNLVLGIEPETTFTEDFNYEVCPDAVVPIIIEATPVNYDASQVSINWFYAFDASATPELIIGENSLTLPVLEGGVYTIEVSFNDTGCTSSQSQEVIELESCFIPQGISPNGDGMNDSFDLSNFRVTRLEIFNRYGTSVFEKSNYVDEWVGQSSEGDELPVGTYFYAVDFEDRESETGWVYLQREK